VRDDAGRDRSYQIVGVDEADPSSGRITFVAPLARALLGRSLGESLSVRTPHGEEELDIVEISYPDSQDR
jgi:transcription elongation factor GreB